MGAQNALGRLYREGRAMPADYAKARHWYGRAAAAGDARAIYQLGLMEELGQGGAKDDAAAIGHYRRAAETGLVAAQARLGLALARTGQTSEAVTWLTRAAEAGDATAANNLGVILEQGKGVAKDPAQAARWYRQAAEAGDRVAQNNLGVLYRDGRGVEKNLDEALRWFRRSAEAGYPKAQLNLGLLLKAGAAGRSAP